MSAKVAPNEGIGRSSRGGVSVARAQRLSDKVDKKKGSTSKWLLALPVGAAAVAAAVYYNAAAPVLGKTDTASVQVASKPSDIADSTAKPPVANKPLVLSEPKDAPMIQTEAPAAVLEQAANPPATEAKPTVIATPAACIAGVETNLSELQGKFAKKSFVPWSVRQEDVTKLVQRVIDCPTAALQVTGSLELLGLGLADLQVEWSADTHLLKLTTIDASALKDGKTSAGTTTVSADGTASGDAKPTAKWMNFVLQ